MIEFVRMDVSAFEDLIDAPQQHDEEDITAQDDVFEVSENSSNMPKVIDNPLEGTPDVISIVDDDNVGEIDDEGADEVPYLSEQIIETDIDAEQTVPYSITDVTSEK